jgi:hypothetical protein
MGRHRKLKEATRAFGIALLLAQQSMTALAFTPEPTVPPSVQVTPPANYGQQQPGLLGPQADLNDPLSQLNQPKGTELNIPGIGSVGTLPKLDFGLELLYGPKNGPDALQLDQHGQEGDVQIKGTFTHKF